MLLEYSTTIDWNRFFDFAMTLVSVLTFIGGYLLGQLNKWRDDKKAINNIRTVIFWELSFIDHVIRNLMKIEGDGVDTDVQKFTLILRLDHEIFDKYIDKLNLLNSEELHSILFAYQSIKYLMSTAQDYKNYFEENALKPTMEGKDPGENVSAILEKYGDILTNKVKFAKISTASALTILVEGRKDLQKKLIQLYFSGDI